MNAETGASLRQSGRLAAHSPYGRTALSTKHTTPLKPNAADRVGRAGSDAHDGAPRNQRLLDRHGHALLDVAVVADSEDHGLVAGGSADWHFCIHLDYPDDVARQSASVRHQGWLASDHHGNGSDRQGIGHLAHNLTVIEHGIPQSRASTENLDDRARPSRILSRIN